MTDQRLTTIEYWDAGYGSSANTMPLDVNDFRRHADRRVVESIEALGLEGRKVLEVGAGNSAILSHLARRYAGRAEFTGLDYTPAGCRLLAERALREGATIEVVQEDLLDPPPSLLGRFDVSYSIGVVEHFRDLALVLEAKKRLMAPGGRILTLIPNMRGTIGTLVRSYNRAVYDLHVPHDMASLTQGHIAAGLVVERAFFLCSTHFGVLSCCFGDGVARRGYSTYRWLSRVSKAVWFLEARLGELPAFPVLSPYLVVVSRVGGDGQ